MRIDGEWLLFDDNILRPVIRGEILTETGGWQEAEFLVETLGPIALSLVRQPR